MTKCGVLFEVRTEFLNVIWTTIASPPYFFFYCSITLLYFLNSTLILSLLQGPVSTAWKLSNKIFLAPIINCRSLLHNFISVSTLIFASKPSFSFLQRVNTSSYFHAVLEMGRYTPVYHTGTSFCSWISWWYFSIYTTSIYIFFSFFWRYILVSLLTSTPAFLNIHVEQCLRRQP
jgi:hypothetical protein